MYKNKESLCGSIHIRPAKITVTCVIFELAGDMFIRGTFGVLNSLAGKGNNWLEDWLHPTHNCASNFTLNTLSL